MLHETMCAERQRLEREIVSLQARLKELPEGKLVCVRNGCYTKWYRSDRHDSVYIPKREKAFAEQLAVKKYLQMRLKELLQEQRAIDFYLRHHNIILMPAMRNTYYLRILYIQNFFRPILLPNHRNFKNGWRSLTKAIRLIRSSVFIRRVQVFLCVPNQKR